MIGREGNGVEMSFRQSKRVENVHEQARNDENAGSEAKHNSNRKATLWKLIKTEVIRFILISASHPQGYLAGILKKHLSYREQH